MNTAKVISIPNGLAYASFKIVKYYETLNDESPSGLYFNKAIAFINTHLKTEGKDLAVPHCWYRWGDEVVRYYMPRELKWTHEEDAYTKVSWKGDVPDSPDYDIKTRIDSIVQEMTDIYGIPGQIQNFVYTIYKEAPFEFQRKYKQVRDLFYETSYSRIMDENGKRTLLIGALDEALKTFPTDDIFEEVGELKPKFKKLMEYGLKSLNLDLKSLNEVSEEFWFLFCYYLRIHPSAHENVQQDTIRYWKRILEDKRIEFIENFSDHALEFSHAIPELLTDDEIAPYVDQANKDLEEFDQSFLEFKDSVAGLDDFLTESKKKYRFGGLN